MKIALLLALISLLAWPAVAQTPAPASGTTKMNAAPRIPVVQAPRDAHAHKVAPPPAKKTTAKPAAPVAVAPVVAAPAGVPAPAPEAPAEAAKPVGSGAPVPRFMSFRFDDVNLRVGPGLRYPIDWVYHRKDLPVEILRELDDWRLVQDQDSVRGWVRATTLSPRRGVIVRGAEHVLRSKASDDGTAVARLKPGVVGHVRGCAADSQWCEVEVGVYRGWLKRDEIFGVYPNEAVGG